METQTLQVINNNHVALAFIVHHESNIWEATQQVLIDFRDIYLQEFSVLPTNTQFVEHGVKESDFISLGNRNETDRSILAIAHGSLVPNAPQQGRDKIQADCDNSNEENEHETNSIKVQRKYRM
eukprot:6224417-Ditylum_brightwellii.AAC.1